MVTSFPSRWKSREKADLITPTCSMKLLRCAKPPLELLIKHDHLETSPSMLNSGSPRLICWLSGRPSKKSKCRSSSPQLSTKSSMRWWAAENHTTKETGAKIITKIADRLVKDVEASHSHQLSVKTQRSNAISHRTRRKLPLTNLFNRNNKSQPLFRSSCPFRNPCKRLWLLRHPKRKRTVLVIWFTHVSSRRTVMLMLARLRACCWMRRWWTWTCWWLIRSTFQP